MAIAYCNLNPKWNPFKKRLADSTLTLMKLREIEDEVLLLLTEREEEGREEILTWIDEKRAVLIEKEISDGISCDVLKMMQIRNTLPPEDWEDRILSMKKGATQTSLKVIEGMEFGFHEPLVYELNPETIESTFASRMTKIAGQLRENHSIVFYEENLSVEQKREVEKFSKGALDPDHMAYAIDLYVASLRKQIMAAEAFYFGRVKEGVKKLQELSKAIQGRIDDLMVESVAACGKTREAIVAAILHSVEEQMGMQGFVA